MTKTTNPFFPFDPTAMADEMAKAMGQFKVPGLDMEAILDGQRKNLEALAEANRKALEGSEAVARRQAEILQETMAEATKAVEALSTADSPQSATARQAELMKAAFVKAQADMKELADMAAKSGQDAAETIAKRFAESLDEIRKAAETAKE